MGGSQILQDMRMLVIKSGLLVDEDIALVHSDLFLQDLVKSETPNTMVYFNILCGALVCLCNINRPIDMIATGIVVSIPMIASHLFTYCERRRLSRMPIIISELLVEFRNLSDMHTQVTQFLNHLKLSLSSKSTVYLKLTQETEIEFSKMACEIEIDIVKSIQNMIRELHKGLKGVNLDMEEFERATSVTLKHEDIKDCIFNSSFLEGQLLLLRSHLLTTVCLMCSRKGDRAVLVKIVTTMVPQLRDMINSGVSEIRIKLNSIRFPPEIGSLNLRKLEYALQFRPVRMRAARLRKNIEVIVSSVNSTVRILRQVSLSLENIETNHLDKLEEAMGSLSEESFKCHIATGEFKKLLEISKGNKKSQPNENEEINLETPEELSSTDGNENPSEDIIEPQNLSGDQLFVTDNNVDESDEEREAVAIVKSFMGGMYPDWLRELQQSEQFKRRQSLFKTSLHDRSEAADSSLIQDTPSTSECVGVQIPSAPPLPSLEPTGEENEQLTSPQDVVVAPPLPPLDCAVEETELFSSLQSILSARGQPHEDYYE